MKINVLLLIICVLINICSCSTNDESTQGILDHKSIIGQKITLVDQNNSPYNYGLWIRPINDTYCEAENMTGTSSRYLYTLIDSKTASLVIDGFQILTERVYVYKWEVTLYFESPTKGTFRGTYFKQNTNYVASIVGRFYIGESDNDSEGGGDTESQIQLSTPTVTDISNNGAKVSGLIIGDKDLINECGVCYGTTSHPTVDNSTVKGAYPNINVSLHALQPGTEYYVRLYARVGSNISYGNEVSFITTNGDNEKSDISAVVTMVEEYQGKHSIYVRGEYADPYTTKYLKVGFCAATNESPKVTDITIPEATENPNTNSVRTISGLEGGKRYYIRPYHVDGNNIIYYKGTSAETLGNNLVLSVSIQDDHQFGLVKYKIDDTNTYKLKVSFWSIYGVQDKDLGFISKSQGSESFSVGSYTWEHYETCSAVLECVETGIAYTYKINLK